MKTMKINKHILIAIVGISTLIVGCGGSGGSSETTSNKFDGENCITTKTYIKITKKSLLEGAWYQRKQIVDSSGLHYSYKKYEFKKNGTVLHSSCSGSCKQIYRRELSYELVDGALVIDRSNFSDLYTLDRIRSDDSWALKRQNLYGRECQKTISSLVWSHNTIKSLD